MLKSERRLLSKGVVSPTTYGTLLIRVAVTFIILCSSAAATLYVIALGVDQIYRLHIDKNVYYTPSGATTPVLLLPQLDATVGLVTACVGDSFFARASRSGVQNLVVATLGSRVLPSVSVTTLQRQLESEFLFGYDTARACGTNTTKLQSISGFGYASYALSLFFVLGACISALLFCLMVGDTDVLAGSPSLDKDSNAINVDNLGIPGAYLMYKLKRHLVHEVPLLISLLTCSGMSLVFSICAMGVTIAVDLSSYKCGTPVCRSFEKSMKDFFQELSSVNIAVAAQPVYSCKRGVALPFTVAGFVLSLLSFLFSAFIFGWFSCAHRRREMLSLRDQLFRLAEVQGLIGTITGGDTPFPLAQSRQVSGVASTGTVSVSLGERDASGNVVAYRRGASGGAATRGAAAAFSAVEIELRQSRSVGARIGLYRTMKQFMASEDVARQAVAAQEQLELFSLLAMREALWYGEELRLLHRFTLNWFIGPPLDLCVLETNARQLIMDDYSNGLSALLKSIVSGFDDDGEPAQAWERGGPLPAAEASQWHRQTERWQQTAALLAPRIRMSASYARADPPLRSPQATDTALLIKTAATHTSLDTGRWLAILDRLRASPQEDGGFLTRSASPLLVLRRNTSVFANFDDDDTSASSNVFSNPSFLPAGGDEALVLPVDHLRPHLVRAAYVTKAPPPPPARLTVLPQLDTKRKRVASGKSGNGRRRRSAGSFNSTSISGVVSPHGRAPSPSTRSPAVTSHSPPHAASHTDNDSFPLTTSADRGDHLQAVVRPFSTRDGTASGRSPFQNAMERHNASSASPRATTPQDSLARAGGGAAPATAFSPGSAWRTQRPT